MNEQQISDYIETHRSLVEKALDHATLFSDDCPDQLRKAIRYSLLAPGKRLRPLFVLMAAELCGGSSDKALPAAVAVEMVHAYSLIHDDLPAMDNDSLRRGQPTCHCQFDEATAILAGDALLTAAFEFLAGGICSKIAAVCCLELAKAAGASGMVGGQQDDMLISGIVARNNEKRPFSNDDQPKNFLPDNDQAKAELLYRIHLRKTIAMIRASLRLGGIVAEATPGQLEALDKFGTAYGLAFQISDDILDCIGKEETVGKRLQKDAQDGKLTYVTLFGLERSRKIAHQKAEEAIRALDIFSPELLPLQTFRHWALTVSNRER